jgi:hypothetical protein
MHDDNQKLTRRSQAACSKSEEFLYLIQSGMSALTLARQTSIHASSAALAAPVTENPNIITAKIVRILSNLSSGEE